MRRLLKDLLTTSLLLSMLQLSHALPLKISAMYQASIHPISNLIANEMQKYSWWPRCPVHLNDLRYVKLNYWGFDRKIHTGALIVHKRVANDVVDIFKALFIHRFTIDSMSPRYLFAEQHLVLLLSDATAAFMCRKMVGNSGKYSLHSYGVAIDINPVENPYIKGDLVIPVLGIMFADRKLKALGMIHQNSAVVKAFKKHGWTWGGNWRTRKDYMHFQKRINFNS